MLLGLPFIVFQINEMNFCGINFSPLKKMNLVFTVVMIYEFQVILKIMCTWVSFSKLQIDIC